MRAVPAQQRQLPPTSGPAAASAGRVAVQAVLSSPDCAVVLASIAARVAHAWRPSAGADAVFCGAFDDEGQVAALKAAYAGVADRLAELTARHLGPTTKQSPRAAAIQRQRRVAVVTVPDPATADRSGKNDRDNDADSPDDRDAAATTAPHNSKFPPREQQPELPVYPSHPRSVAAVTIDIEAAEAGKAVLETRIIMLMHEQQRLEAELDHELPAATPPQTGGASMLQPGSLPALSIVRRAGTNTTALSRSLPGSPTRRSPSSLEEDPHARSFTDFKRPNKRARQGSSSSSLGISTKAQPPASYATPTQRPQCQQQQFGVIENRQARQASREDVPRYTTEMVLTSAIKARAVSAITKIVAVAAYDAARHVVLQLREHRAAAATATPTTHTACVPGTAACAGTTGGPEATKPSAKSAIKTVTIQAAGYVTNVVGNQLKVLAKKLLDTAVPEVATNCAAIVAQLLKPDSVSKIVLKTATLLHITLPRAGVAPGAAAAIANTVERLIQARTSKPPPHAAGLASRQYAPVALTAVQLPVSHAGKENAAVAAVSMVE